MGQIPRPLSRSLRNTIDKQFSSIRTVAVGLLNETQE